MQCGRRKQGPPAQCALMSIDQISLTSLLAINRSKSSKLTRPRRATRDSLSSSDSHHQYFLIQYECVRTILRYNPRSWDPCFVAAPESPIPIPASGGDTKIHSSNARPWPPRGGLRKPQAVTGTRISRYPDLPVRVPLSVSKSCHLTRSATPRFTNKRSR